MSVTRARLVSDVVMLVCGAIFACMGTLDAADQLTRSISSLSGQLLRDDNSRPTGGSVSDLLRDDQNGDFTPGPLMRLVMRIDEPPAARELDSGAYIELSDEARGQLERASRNTSEARDSDQFLEMALARGQAELARALEPYRVGADGGEKPAIRVGASWQSQEPLGANINNYAPDEFQDDELEKLFELTDSVRQRLAAEGAADGQSRSPVEVDELRIVNARVLRDYIAALAGIRLAGEHKPPAGDADECAICRESMAAARWVRLPCGHAYHSECTTSWARAQVARANSTCPGCRGPFRLPFAL